MFGRRLAAALIAAVALSAAIAVSASARYLSVNSQTFRVTWASMILQNQDWSISVECNVTIEGTFNERILNKVRGLLIGHVTRAFIGNCVGEENEIYALNGIERLEGVTVGNTLPWHIQYVEFLGTLPTISSIRIAIVDASFLVRSASLFELCLYRSTTASPWRALMLLAPSGTGVVTSFLNIESAPIPRAGGSVFSCPSTISPSGGGGMQVLNSTASIVFRLI